MLRLYLAGRNGTKDISQLAESVVWSGDKASVTRQLTASVLQGSGWPVPRTGDGVTMGDENGALFTGYIVQRSMDSERSRMTVTCHDRGRFLRGNDGTYQFRGETAEGMVRAVCRDKGIPIAALAATGVRLSRKFAGVRLDKIVSTAYTLAAQQNGKRYAIRMTPEGLLVKEKGVSAQSLELRSGSNLIRAETTESVVSMVNSVAIYSEDGALLDVVGDRNAQALYGVMERHLTQRTGQDAAAQARALIEDGGLEQSVTVEVLGDRRLITGETVVVREDVTGLRGLFWIDGDKHTWRRGQYTCRLTLNCRSVMNETTAGSELS